MFEVYDSEVAKGEIIAQEPEAGKSATVGSKVQFIASLGKGTGAVKVPSVTGETPRTTPSQEIEDAGLKVQKISQYNPDVKKGVVAEQFPESGATAAKGSEVLIVVSKGAEPSSDGGGARRARRDGGRRDRRARRRGLRGDGSGGAERDRRRLSCLPVPRCRDRGGSGERRAHRDPSGPSSDPSRRWYRRSKRPRAGHRSCPALVHGRMIGALAALVDGELLHVCAEPVDDKHVEQNEREASVRYRQHVEEPDRRRDHRQA